VTSRHGIVVDHFGVCRDGPVDRYRLTNSAGMTVTVLTYGGILQALTTPDRRGQHGNVLLGLPDLAAYETHSPYFGAIIGRYANRVAGAEFAIDGNRFGLAANEPPNTLHGGTSGFDKRLYAATVVKADEAVAVTLTRLSPDGEEGFPGNLHLAVTYTLTDSADLRIDYRAHTDADTIVNLTNHAYFNLAGEGSGAVYDHEVTINASRYLPTDSDLIPTGELAPVAGTPFDFRNPRTIGDGIRDVHPQLVCGRGYDHNWVLEGTGGSDGLSLAAEVHHPGSGRTLTVLTDQPGLQFYSGNMLDGTIAGAGGKTYRQGDAFTVETQHFPDAPHQPHFPSTVLRAGETMTSSTVYRFSVRPAGGGGTEIA